MNLQKEQIDILIVEDVAQDAELVRQAFSSHGDRFHVTLADSLGEARSQIQKQAPDLVICDIHLREGQGIDLISNGEEKAREPVVIITNQGNETIAAETIKASKDS